MGAEEEEEERQEKKPNLVNEDEDVEATTTTTKEGDGDCNVFPSWSPPVLRFDVPPNRTYHFHHQFRNGSNPNNFLKGVKWSPDGSCLLTSSEDNTLRIFDLPENKDGTQTDACFSTTHEDSYVANLIVNEGESVYDYCWYPYMSASDPTTCVFATTSRDHPIHLWDATYGQLRCTYRAYDAMDEITAAFSVAFNNTGTKIFAGYNKSLRVFDLHRPGRDFEQHSTLQGNKEGQSGMISAIAFSPTHNGMLATGSYNQTTAIYTEDNMELLYVLHGQEGGVTHVQFSKDGNYLYTGGRRETWTCMRKLYRSSESTNQRILFDIEPCGRHLGTGGQDGQVHIYDLQTGQWLSSFQAASDTVNGFCFHPYLPLSASSSGHRRFGMPDDEHYSLSGEENCASIWSFCCSQMSETEANFEWEDSNTQVEPENILQDP